MDAETTALTTDGESTISTLIFTSIGYTSSPVDLEISTTDTAISSSVSNTMTNSLATAVSALFSASLTSTIDPFEKSTAHLDKTDASSITNTSTENQIIHSSTIDVFEQTTSDFIQ